MRATEFTTEASYPGNLGVMEVMKFYQQATDDQKTLLKHLMGQGKTQLAWELIQKVTGVKLQGAEFTTEDSDQSEFLKVASDFIPWVKDRLNLTQLPEIEFLSEPLSGTFGYYRDGVIRVVTAGRHPVDVLRTLAHELIHYTQDQDGELKPESGATGSSEENEANAGAGIVMRDFSQEFPDAIQDVSENFQDGKVKGKSRPGRVKKAGASCKGSVTNLRAKAKKHGGEKGKMYHWCANMKSGRSKK